MAEQQKPSSATEQPPTHAPPTSEAAWRSGVHYPNPAEAAWSGEVRFPNPPDPVNPDPATLREQWQFATRRFSRWHARAWGTAFLGGSPCSLLDGSSRAPIPSPRGPVPPTKKSASSRARSPPSTGNDR